MRIKEAGKYGLGIRMWCTQSKLVLLSSERKGPLSWTPSTVVCISPPLLRALLQPHQPYYFWTHNAGLTLYECGHRNLYCDRNSDRQVSCGQTWEGLNKLIIMIIISNKLNKYRRRLKSQRGEHISVSKYRRQQNIGIDKIKASTKYQSQQNIGANENYIQVQWNISLLIWLGKVHSSWHLSDLAGVLLCRSCLLLLLSLSNWHLLLASLKGQCHEIFRFWFFSSISFPPAPEYPIRTVSNFFENSRKEGPRSYVLLDLP